MTVKERIILFLKSKKLSQRAFEQQVGLSNGYVNNIKSSIGQSVSQKIALHFPDLNMGWIFTGEGEMFKKQAPEHFSTVHEAIVKYGACENCKAMKAQIKLLEKQNGGLHKEVREMAEEIGRLKHLLDMRKGETG